MPGAAEYGDFQRTLLKEKGSKEQVRFLQSALEREAFLERMAEVPREGSKIYPVPDWKFTDREFKDPPYCTEAEIYDHWRELSPFVASRPSFWAQATIDLVRSECIKPIYLAGNLRANGECPIGNALKDKTDEHRKSIDDCVRTILRRMSGIQFVRGNRSVFSDCTLARAWWRERLIDSVSNKTGLDKVKLGKVLRISKGHWEWLVTAMVSRSTVFGHEIVQRAFVKNLANLLPSNSNSKQSWPIADTIQKACQGVCVVGASIELPILDFSEVDAIVSNLIVGAANEMGDSQ